MDNVARPPGSSRVPTYFGLYAEIRHRDRIDPDERTDVPAIEEASRVTFGDGVGPQAALVARSATDRALDLYRRVQALGDGS